MDRDQAEIYRVETQTLSQTAQRNIERFPSDFMFQRQWEATDLKQLIDRLSKDKNIVFEQMRFYPQKPAIECCWIGIYRLKITK